MTVWVGPRTNRVYPRRRGFAFAFRLPRSPLRPLDPSPAVLLFSEPLIVLAAKMPNVGWPRVAALAARNSMISLEEGARRAAMSPLVHVRALQAIAFEHGSFSLRS
jgi:hypothetical protein